MYPDWPQSPADLVPLPQCDGPKLKPFPFQGPQSIQFLDYIGGGLHAHVFKVMILGQIYALKLFRFAFGIDWDVPTFQASDDREAMNTFYNYSEPFNCECRAYGRLQEAGHDELAVQCFGYILLDEKHEQIMMDQFSHLDELEFDGDAQTGAGYDLRSFFLCKDGRVPPIRGIVKEFGQSPEELDTFRTQDARKILRDIIQLHQLGIINIDVAIRQIINGKICDFSTAVTVPHFMTTTELNPRLTPEWISAMEFEVFQFTICDLWEFDDMVFSWNLEHETKVLCFAFPSEPCLYVRRSAALPLEDFCR
ncbi:hypothetical protein E4U53_007778 [Claviceps sorghi]|nr:hypothetical protein E4U53_007778 [Claviceps sorghi]